MRSLLTRFVEAHLLLRHADTEAARFLEQKPSFDAFFSSDFLKIFGVLSVLTMS